MLSVNGFEAGVGVAGLVLGGGVVYLAVKGKLSQIAAVVAKIEALPGEVSAEFKTLLAELKAKL